jgi:acyl-CoA dehydrogenase
LTQRVIAVDHFAPEELEPHYRKAPAPSLGHNSRGATVGANQS